MTHYTRFEDIPLFAYGLLMIDPGWTFELYSKKGEAKSAQAQYDCMTLEDIQALPIGHLATKDAILFLWATNPMLPQAIETLSAWGFKYVTAETRILALVGESATGRSAGVSS